MSMMSELSNYRLSEGKKRLCPAAVQQMEPGLSKNLISQIQPLAAEGEEAWAQVLLEKSFPEALSARLGALGVPETELRAADAFAVCGDQDAITIYSQSDRGLLYREVYENGQPIVSHHLNREQVAHAEHRCFWVDTEEDVVFAKLHMILNAGDLTADRVEAFLDDLITRPAESGFIQMVIHEQHFYPDYVAYEPDYGDRILTMAKWMQEHGYESVSLSDIIEETEGPAL